MYHLVLRPVIAIFVCAIIFFSATSIAKQNPQASTDKVKRPNFVLVLADDLGFSDLGSYGGEIETPVLDKLAKNGLRYTQAYNTGRCWPSRASLMSGFYAQQVGLDPRDFKEDWPRWSRQIPHYLKDANYRSYMSGKWHLRRAPNDPVAAAFDRTYHLPDHDRFFTPKKHLLDNKDLPAVKKSEGYYSTIAIADYAIDFLKQHDNSHKEKPFFLYLGFTAPHFPLHALPEDIEKYKDSYKKGWDYIRKQRLKGLKKQGIYKGKLANLQADVTNSWSLSHKRLIKEIHPGEVGRAIPWKELNDLQKNYEAEKMAVHAAMVDRLDQEIGRVMKQVEAMGEAENTVFIFLSDNGATSEQMHRGDGNTIGAPLGSAETYLALGPGWSTAANTPFSLHKHWMHEGGTATPLIINWPAGIDAKGIRKTPTHIIDLLPTILDIAGLKPNKIWNEVVVPPLPGKSLTATFDNDPQWTDRELFYSHNGHAALRVGSWKLVKRKNGEGWELYDMKSDRAERNNLASKHPQRVTDMVARWEQLRLQYSEIDYNSASAPRPKLEEARRKGKKKMRHTHY